jgi:hypothetical protein
MDTMRKALAAGVATSLAGFAIVFWAASRCLALIPRLETSPWFKPAANGIVLLVFATGPLIRLRRPTRAKTPSKSRPV